MCLIIVKSKGIEKPSNDILTKAYTANDDLCGVSWLRNRGRILECYRGLTLAELQEINGDLRINDSVLYHFRIATSGNVNVINSHPFPLYQNKSKVHTRPKIAIAHNGITRGIGNKKYSDTAILVQYLEDNHLDYDFLLTLLSSNGGGKFAVIDSELAGIMLYGEFLEDELDGLLYSNMYWKTGTTGWKYGGSWGKWNPITHTWDDSDDDTTEVNYPKNKAIDVPPPICDICYQPEKPLTKELGLYLCEDCLKRDRLER